MYNVMLNYKRKNNLMINKNKVYKVMTNYKRKENLIIKLVFLKLKLSNLLFIHMFINRNKMFFK